ncbi:PilZ domain-containing protein [Saccharospirillum sp. MSK14-1]|uniref:PilZ domain-containing protein n=1 Tax=Saccharospirillum sp. MSK14-1 TaxID=1897632 RepID=UPI0013048EAD|nr:PilZ domain-containing protein [Saccharospirillum sp. MSK14-1]
MRQYIRHATDIPLSVQAADTSPPDARLKNFSCGGLSFCSDRAITLGQRLRLSIDIDEPPFEIDGQVVWCHVQDEQYLIGVCFHTDQDAFSVRMVEQLCRIEEYREKVQRTEGRDIDRDQAAREWIELHAAEFPNWQPNNAD